MDAINEGLHFSAHARLKDIVGSGLIMSDGIAIIELIKNSKDAGSSSVRIEFRESKFGKGETELIIADEGHGMSMEDIEFKWLNIAYSEKKASKPTYGVYAGSKGIGRFSCDRLGSKLEILTKKVGSPYIKLEIDWTEYEVDQREIDIGQIELSAEQFSREQFSPSTGEETFEIGTMLVIRDLRSDWDRLRLAELRSELERFVIDPEKDFSVQFNHWRYPESDPINAPIENKIFNDLDFRTTSIRANTFDDGSKIRIELRHDGDYVFRTVEKNPYSQIKNVHLNLHFLNQPAKAFFNRKTGYRSVDYGSVFLFLNGFRVFPYGSFGDDWLGIQRRHAQGQRRFFGTRDLVGFIKVTDPEGTDFIPVSSREGLVRNQAFHQLVTSDDSVESCIDKKNLFGFFHKAMRKLEKFVVDGLDWDRIDRETSDLRDSDLLAGNYEYLVTEKPVLETIDSIVKIRSPENYIDDIEINVKYLSELAQQETEKYDEMIEALEEKFEGTPINELKSAERRDLSKFISRQAKELEQKNKTNLQLETKSKKVELALKTEEKRRIFAEFESSADKKRILDLHHQIGLVAGHLLMRMNRIAKQYKKNPDSFQKEQVFELIENLIFQVQKISNVTKLATKANFDLATNRVHGDMIQFIAEYLENFQDLSFGWGVKLIFSNVENIELKRTFRPAEISIVIDNLIDNSGKANAKNIAVRIGSAKNKVMIQFEDDGRGLESRYRPSELFEKGISTTSGSGIGLSHAKQIIEDIDGTINIENFESGVRVTMEFNR